MIPDDDAALLDTRYLFSQVEDEKEYIPYGDKIKLWVAPKEGKANTLLADQLFSPSLLLAERIERGLLPLAGKTIVELGAGTALPSMLACTAPEGAPLLAAITDYPDAIILSNLHKNLACNRDSFAQGCQVIAKGYEWGTDPKELHGLLPITPDPPGYDVVILSDLLHFHSSHNELIRSVTLLLKRSPHAVVYVAAGRYTSLEVCQSFLRMGEEVGLRWEEGENDGVWHGQVAVGSWTKEELGLRKANVRWWIGRWT